LGADHCSAETISAGTFRIVEEIRSRRPNAKIVLNTILPRGQPGVSVYETGTSWLEITKINQWLECYAKSMNDLEFFNATHIFLQENETIRVEEYYQDPVHPSAAGYAVWGLAIVEKVLSLTQ
jgi:lysophospholipase L1-like esterase